MFETLQAHLDSCCSLIAERAEGVAFFRAAKDLYRLGSIKYVCINISTIGRSKYCTHCVYSDTCVKQFSSPDAIRIPVSSGDERSPGDARSASNFTVPLNRRRGETAFFGIMLATEPERLEQRETILRECKILGNYFHGHVLRINGHDSDQEILISARELDCLKWTAAGKTALEASIILGISERTVRFHLNAAREKLDCVTTTQAVAKAVVNQLIDV
jgi:DNA-binding CsgD family transcriptional regulator